MEKEEGRAERKTEEQMSRGVKGQQRTTTLDGEHPRTHTRQNGPTSSCNSHKVDGTKIQRELRGHNSLPGHH